MAHPSSGRTGCLLKMNTKETTSTQKLAIAGVLTAAAVAGSLISVPVAGSKCAPVQHMVNVFAAVMLGPWWGIGIAFCASLIRNLLGIGSLLAFPGSMVGSLMLWSGLPTHPQIKSYLCCRSTGNRNPRRSCSLSGSQTSHGTCPGRIHRIHDPVFYLNIYRKCTGLYPASCF